MTTEPLAQDDDERDVFLRALRDYSESCEPIILHSGCPFAVDTAPGVRGCAEECMDILGRHEAPRPLEERDLGGGLTVRRARRPRARRKPGLESKAFDARELFLEDKGHGPPQQWQLSSVLVGLADAIGTLPSPNTEKARERLAEIRKLAVIAEARGLEFETQIVPYLRNKVVPNLFSEIMRSLGPNSTSEAEGELGRWKSWAEVHLNLATDEASDEEFPNAFTSLLRPVARWAATCSTDDLLGWAAPAADFWSNPESSNFPVPENFDTDGGWLIERLTKTYLTEWSTESLKREWEYIHGQRRPPCSPTELNVRPVEETELALVMADRLVSRPEQSPDLSESMVGPAIDFLKEGRRPEASALFEAVLRLNPTSGPALNNLAFCLLPDDPSRSLKHLEKALSERDLSQPLANKDVAVLNKVLALASVGRLTSALDLANSQIADEPQSDEDHRESRRAWLWDPGSILGGEPAVLVDVTDVPAYIETLARVVKAEVDRTVEQVRVENVI